jgi:hypothetical protein
MVRVIGPSGEAYCVDATETTNAHYKRFLAADVELNTQEPRCQWNTTWEPGFWEEDNEPVVAVDFCDAVGHRRRRRPGAGDGCVVFVLFAALFVDGAALPRRPQEAHRAQQPSIGDDRAREAAPLEVPGPQVGFAARDGLFVFRRGRGDRGGGCAEIWS